MIVKDLLFSVNRRHLIDNLYNRYFSAGTSLYRPKEKVRRNFTELLAYLEKITPVENHDVVLVAYKYRNEFEVNPQCNVETTLYDKQTVLNNFLPIRGLAHLRIGSMTEEQAEDCVDNKKFLAYLQDDVQNGSCQKRDIGVGGFIQTIRSK